MSEVSADALFVGLVTAAKVLLQAQVQRAIVGHARATITSAVGLGQDLTGLVLYLGIGAVASQAGWAVSFLCLAAALILTAWLLGLRQETRARG